MSPLARPAALVADDEPLVRSLVASFLNPDYDVTTAVDGSEAEQVLQANPDIAIAVIDCDMPKRRGPEVLARARAAGCRVPILLVSGAADPASLGLAGDPLSAFLAKPFSRGQVIRAVAALVGQRRDR